MKRAVTVLFSLVYLFLVTGITINVHYCMGEVKSVTLYSEGQLCCCETDSMPLGCCSDETLVVQFSPDDQLAESGIVVAKHAARVEEEISTPIRDHRHSQRSDAMRGAVAIAPGPPIWLKHCNLTYYG